MKRGVVVTLLIAMLALSVQVSLFVNSFYGFHGGAECSLCHNEPANAWNSSYADAMLTLDGHGTEEFWGDANWKASMYIPVAGAYGANEIFVHLKFAQNSSHFFVLASWGDASPFEGTATNKYSAADGISMIYNINSSDFAACYAGGMTTDAADEYVDVVTWKAGTGVTAPADYLDWTLVDVPQETDLDYVMDDSTIAADTSADWQAFGVYGNESEHNQGVYQVEFVRPLVTGDDYDVQFDNAGYHEFAIAIYNGTAGSSHTSSFGHAVWVYNPDDPNVDKVTVSYDETNTETVTQTTVVTNTETISDTTDKAGLFSLFGISLMVLVGSAVMITRKRN